MYLLGKRFLLHYTSVEQLFRIFALHRAERVV